MFFSTRYKRSCDRGLNNILKRDFVNFNRSLIFDSIEFLILEGVKEENFLLISRKNQRFFPISFLHGF